MRRIEEKEISELRHKGAVSDSIGKNLKSVLPLAHKKSSAPKATEGRLQTKAIEALSGRIAQMLQAYRRNSDMLVEAIIKAKPPDIKIPAIPASPQPITKWKFIVERDSQGFIESIKAEAR